jgi:hypothetical protein
MSLALRWRGVAYRWATFSLGDLVCLPCALCEGRRHVSIPSSSTAAVFSCLVRATAQHQPLQQCSCQTKGARAAYTLLAFLQRQRRGLAPGTWRTRQLRGRIHAEHTSISLLVSRDRMVHACTVNDPRVSSYACLNSTRRLPPQGSFNGPTFAIVMEEFIPRYLPLYSTAL